MAIAESAEIEMAVIGLSSNSPTRLLAARRTGYFVVEEPTMPFEPGDVVFLKSGGQPMTVVGKTGKDIECIWMGEEGDLFREAIPSIALSTYEDLDLDDEDDEDEDEDDADETPKSKSAK